MTGDGPNLFESQPPFSFSDFDDMSFDWEAIENANDFIAPTWI